MKRLAAIVLTAFAAMTAAAFDSSDAILNLLNSQSAGSPKAYRESLAQVKTEAEAGRALQQYVFAMICRDDPKAPEFLAASREKIRKLAETRNNALAWYLLSMENQDVKLLKRAVDGGNVQALNAWGMLMHNHILTDPDMDAKRREEVARAVFEVFGKAAGQRDANGLYNLGMCYMNGLGCTPDEHFAFNCFRSAAEMGHPEAINNLGGCYRDGIAVERDLVKATGWFKKSADCGNPYGLLNYGLALQNGEGVDRDEQAAFKCFETAAAADSAEALNVMAVCYMTGRGTEKNEAKAVELFEKSAAMGFPPAMDNLSECYDSGTGVKANALESTVWKLRAKAAVGDRNAAIWLEQNGYSPK